MLRIILCSTLVFLVSLISPGYCWQIENVGGDGSSSSLALTQNDIPIISFAEYSYPFNIPTLKIAYKKGSTWQIALVDGTVGTGANNSLVLDNNDLPNIAYRYLNDSLRFAKFNGFSWIIETVDPVSDNSAYISLTLDDFNKPHISYYDGTNKNIKYAYNDGTKWNTYIIEHLNNGGFGCHTSIKIDDNQNPHIAYHDGTMNNLKYAVWDGSNWNISIIDGSDAGSYGLSLAFDHNDNPHIAYYGHSRLNYAFFDGATWSFSIVDSLNNCFPGIRPSIVLDKKDNPCISYIQETYHLLKYARRINSTWQVSIVTDNSTMFNYYTNSLALDSNGNPHISFCTLTLGLAYAHHDQVGVELAYFTAQPAQSGDIRLGWQTSSAMQGVVGFNLYRSVTTTVKKPVWIKLNAALITGGNPYTFVDSSVKPGAGYTYRLTTIDSLGKEEESGVATCSAGEIPSQFAITNIHPNPATSLLACSYIQPTTGEVSFTICDLSGRVVSANSRNLASGNGDAVLDVGALANGVYILNAKAGANTISRRFVVSH